MFFEFGRNRILAGNAGSAFNESYGVQSAEVAFVQKRLQSNVDDFRGSQWAEWEEGSANLAVYLGIEIGIERNKFSSEKPIFSFFPTRDERPHVPNETNVPIAKMRQ